MFQTRHFLLAVSLATPLVLPCNYLPAEDNHNSWTRFRGENGIARIERTNVPLPWQANDIAWEAALPGKGNGSPVVFDGRVFLMSANPDNALRHLLAFDLNTGQQLWDKQFESEPHHLHARSSFASSTPCVDHRGVYFTWGEPQAVHLTALSHTGEQIWTRKFDRFISQHGFGASPALFGNLLILFNSQAAQQLPPGVAPGSSSVIAVDAATGETVWTRPRTTTRACYGVPTRFTDPITGKDALLFANTGDGLFALELATGAPIWNNQVFSKRCVSSPVVVGNLAIGTHGSGGGGNALFAVNMSDPDRRLAFKLDRAAPYVPTPVARDNLLFTWSDNGIVSCLKMPTSDTQWSAENILWSKRIGGNVSSSPVIAGEKLVGVAEDGTVTILSATQEFADLGSVNLGETTRATPLISQNYALFRSDSRLICVGQP